MFRIQVGALQTAAGAADEEAAGVPVAALLADDVHLRAAGSRLPEAAAQAEHHFLRVADLGHVAGHAHALVAAVHAVDEDLSFVPAPAVDLEHAIQRRVGAFEVVGLHVDRRDEVREAGILARRRNLGDRVAAEHLLVARARHVDGGRLAGDDDRLGHAPDFQVGVHRGDEAAVQLDALTLGRGEPGERKRHRICPRSQVLDGILTGPSGDDRARLLDERRARRFDRDAGQDGARGVLDGADDGRLSVGDTGNDDERHQDEDRSHTLDHVVPPRL